jgi:hypothetical protein
VVRDRGACVVLLAVVIGLIGQVLHDRTSAEIVPWGYSLMVCATAAQFFAALVAV